MLWWLVLNSSIKSALWFHFSLLGWGFSYNILLVGVPKWVYLCLVFSVLRPVLLSLYPLIRQSLIKHHSEMASIEYRVNDVRSSKLETGLSSNAESLSKVVDTAASKLPSSSNSPSLHAFSKSCSLKEKHLNGFRKIFQFPRGTSVTFPMERCAFTRLIFCVAFVSPSIRLSCNFWTNFKSPQVNSSLMFGGQS